MWPDNETDIDLLGFDFLVDELLVLLKEPRLLPVTIGVTGDWGSGKSSLLAMTAKELADDKDANFIVVQFSPWKFEGYEDVKAALMQAVMVALLRAVQDDKTNFEKSKELFLRLVRRVNWFAIARTAGVAAIASQTGALPAVAAIAGGGWIDTSGLEGTKAEPNTGQTPYTSVAQFRDEFDALMTGLEEIQGLVVFVDDVDRCMPDTIIETFEAIRLFLHVPKTAYVIAADQRIVQGAIEDRYPTAIKENPSIGRDYLEKILQTTVGIPPLSTPEAESYINLLMADAYVTPEVMSKLRDAAKVQRSKGYLSVCMNEGIARDALNTVPDTLLTAFTVASRISPTLARKHAGNPRQIKRFMNTLMLRQRAAERRKMSLDIAILAKLMVLETVDAKAYRDLFAWQADANGQPLEIVQAETYVASGVPPDAMSDEARAWADRGDVKAWLGLEPPLSKVDMGDYFFFSRDRFSPALPAARLSPELQVLLVNLQSESEKARNEAIETAIALPPEDLSAMYPVLLTIGRNDPGELAMDAAITIASRAAGLTDQLAASLEQIPATSVPLKIVPNLYIRFKPMPAPLNTLVDRWAEGSGPLAKVVDDARKPKPVARARDR